MPTSILRRRGYLLAARRPIWLRSRSEAALTLLPMSGTSSAVMAAARVTRALLDARPAFGSWATEKLGLAPTGVSTRADCMAASFLPASLC